MCYAKRKRMSFFTFCLCLVLSLNILAQAPITNFTADTTTGCAPLTVNFNDFSTPGGAPINSWLWDFGDGNMDTIQNPTHIYLNMGTYNVSLIIADTLGTTDTLLISAYITVNTAPSAPGLITGPPSPCIGTSQTYFIVDPLTSTNWSVPTGWSIDSGQGTYSIYVTVSSSS